MITIHCFASRAMGLYGLLFVLASAPSFGQTYFYDAGSRLVKVVYSQGDGVRYSYDDSDNLTRVEPISLPPAPTTLTANIVAGCVELSWQDNSNNETGFVLMRRSANSYQWQDIARVNANVRQYTDCPAASAGSLVYRIAADSNEGLSAFSAEAFASLGGEPTLFKDDFETPAALRGVLR